MWRKKNKNIDLKREKVISLLQKKCPEKISEREILKNIPMSIGEFNKIVDDNRIGIVFENHQKMLFYLRWCPFNNKLCFKWLCMAWSREEEFCKIINGFHTLAQLQLLEGNLCIWQMTEETEY